VVEIYLERAEQFARARELCRSDPEYSAATALLAVHSAISFNDALLALLTNSRSKGTDHAEARFRTMEACRSRGIATDGLEHLKKLVSAKTNVSYGDQTISFDKAGELATASERFQSWTYHTMKGASNEYS